MTLRTGIISPCDRRSRSDSPLQQLRDDVRRVIRGLADVVHREDAGMVQRGGGAGFLLEPSQPVRIGGELGRQHLDRDVAAEPRVAGPVNPPHAAFAKYLEDAIRPKGIAGVHCSKEEA